MKTHWIFEDGVKVGGDPDHIAMWWAWWPAPRKMREYHYEVFPYCNDRGFLLCFEDDIHQRVNETEELGWFTTLRRAQRAAEKHWEDFLKASQ